MIPEILLKRKKEKTVSRIQTEHLLFNITTQHPMNPFLFPPQPDPMYGPPGMLPPGMVVTGPPMIINGPPPQPLGMGIMTGPPMVVTTATPVTITVCHYFTNYNLMIKSLSSLL